MHHSKRVDHTPERTDEYLLLLVQQGDRVHFGELVERWNRKIFAFILRYVGNREEAQDLTQDTFAKAFQSVGSLSDPGRFSSWLYAIALNECRMRFRKTRRFQPVALEEVEWSRAVAESPTPLAQLETAERVGRLTAAFGELPDEQREVILMKEYQGLKFHEIADILGIPLSTVKSRMYLGLKTLRRLMERAQ